MLADRLSLQDLDPLGGASVARRQQLLAQKALEAQAKEKLRQELELARDLVSNMSALYPPVTIPLASLTNACRSHYQALNQFQPEFSYLTEILALPTTANQSSQSRDRLVHYLSAQLRQLFKTSIYVVDPELIGCPLHFPRPTTAIIRLSLVVSQEAWDVILYEHLTALSEVSNASLTGLIDESLEEVEDSINSQDNPLARRQAKHKREEPPLVSNIRRSSTSVSCYLDDIPVIIDTNPILFLSFQSLLEDLSLFCGKDHLLKRSFVFIWDYLYADSRDRAMELIRQAKEVREIPMETLNKIDGPEFIDQDVLWIMILSIFNKYLPSLGNPLHVLLLFLMDLSFFEQGKHVVTVYGLLPLPPVPHLGFQSNFGDGYTLQIPISQQHPWHLPAALIEKYWNQYNVVNLSGAIHESHPSSGSRRSNPGISLRKRFSANFITMMNPINPLDQHHAYSAIHPLTHELLFPTAPHIRQPHQHHHYHFPFQDFILQHLEHLVSFFSSLHSLSSSGSLSLNSQEKFDLLMLKLLPASLQEDILVRQPELQALQSSNR
jgi:hypothetical protein